MSVAKRQALLSITSSVYAEGANAQEDTVSLITSGELIETENGDRLLCYDEILDESTPAQHVTLLFSGDTVTMDRTGAYQAKLVFARGTRYEGQYQTPYGDMDMAVYCTKLSYEIDESGGELALQYQLDLGGQFAAMRDMRLEFNLKDAP